MSAPYFEIFGLRFPVSHERSFGGGDVSTEKYKVPGKDSGGTAHGGREPKEIQLKAVVDDDEDLDEFLARVNLAYECAEVYPIRADRLCYIGTATAGISESFMDGANRNAYNVDVAIACPESYTYGAIQGLPFTKDAALPQTVELTNNGKIPGKLDFLYLRGGYANGYYTKDVDLSFNQTTIRLINQLCVGDDFQLDRFGNVRHSMDISGFPMIYTKLQRMLGGSDYVTYGTGGTLSGGELFINYSGKILMPMHGPLPVRANGDPKLVFWVEQLAGTPKVSLSFLPDLSDIEDVDYVIKLGWNEVDIPGCQGKEFVAFGLTTGTTSQVTITDIYWELYRYLAEDLMPTVAPTEEFAITVSDGEWSSHVADVQAIYRDGYYY